MTQVPSARPGQLPLGLDCNVVPAYLRRWRLRRDSSTRPARSGSLEPHRRTRLGVRRWSLVRRDRDAEICLNPPEITERRERLLYCDERRLARSGARRDRAPLTSSASRRNSARERSLAGAVPPTTIVSSTLRRSSLSPPVVRRTSNAENPIATLRRPYRPRSRQTSSSSPTR